MEGSGSSSDRTPAYPNSNRNVTRLREIVRRDDHGSWEETWKEGIIPWDLGQPTPVVQHLVQTGSIPKGRVLVPGCGSGYDVVAIADHDHFVVGLDISRSALKKAKDLSASSPYTSYFTYELADFFTWEPTELFDVIFDYMFFCAFQPSLRTAWARKIAQLLKPDGELITLILLVNGQAKGPPYNNSVLDYEEVLTPLGFKALSIEDNDMAIVSRKGMEKLGRWKRRGNPSML